MKKINFIILIAGSVLGVFMSGCGSSSSGNTAGAVVCSSGTTTVNGTVCTANTGALLTTSTRVGYFTQSSNFPIAYADAAGTSMQLGSGYQTLLQNAMGVCNRNAYSGGLAACPAWQQGYQDLVIIMDSANATTADIVVRSYPYIDPSDYYYYSLPSFDQFFEALLGLSGTNNLPIYDPLVLSATVYPINNSTGFELRANGPTASQAWWSLIQFQVVTGQVGNPQISFNMYIDGGHQQMLNAVSGTMNICQTQNCGIQGL